MMSFCFLIEARIAVVNSGREVPIATTVKPMTASEILKDLAIVTAELINKCPPAINKAIPTKQ